MCDILNDLYRERLTSQWELHLAFSTKQEHLLGVWLSFLLFNSALDIFRHDMRILQERITIKVALPLGVNTTSDYSQAAFAVESGLYRHQGIQKA